MPSLVRWVALWSALVFPMILGGCAGTDGGGGSGGSAGSGGDTGSSLAATIDDLCGRLDDCNALEGVSASECNEIVTVCVDQTFVIDSLKQDWGLLAEQCLEVSTCAVFVDCYGELDACNTGACSGVEVTCFPDGDVDGWPSASGSVTACDVCPTDFIPARVDGQVDCLDSDDRVNPGASWTPGEYCSQPVGNLCSMNSSDWNCDGITETRWNNTGSCVFFNQCVSTEGWLGPVPFGCVSINTYVTGCTAQCEPMTDTRTQQCR